jgi:hypothetical protein
VQPQPAVGNRALNVFRWRALETRRVELFVTPAGAWPSLVKPVQRCVDLLKQTLNFFALLVAVSDAPEATGKRRRGHAWY